MKTISLFNHKGGVSKTTTTFNLGWAIARRGLKVLIVDLDSQSNLTGLVLGFRAVADDQMDAFYSSRDNLTMRPIVDALINGVQPSEFSRINPGQLTGTGHENLFLLPGHLDTADLDSQISVALKIASGIPATRNIPGNLPAILRDVANRNEVDYVLYDLSPNVGGLNEVILMSSDFFIVPTSPDYFSLQAIGSLQKNIVKWHKEIRRFKEDNGFDRTYPIQNNPKFLGTVHQRYRPRNEKPGLSFQSWIDKIRQEVDTKFAPALGEINCLTPRSLLIDVLQGSGLAPYDLAHVSDFNSLIAISQQLSKPIFALTDADIRSVGGVFGHAENTMITSRNKFDMVFTDLAERILKLTGNPLPVLPHQR